MSNDSSNPVQEKINLMGVIEDMFMVLSGKEKEVIVKRFSIDSAPKQTLEKIGQSFSVTRERVRQIEKIALGKLRRTVETTKLSYVNKCAVEIVKTYGGVMVESKLLSALIAILGGGEDSELSGLKLALNINTDLNSPEKNNLYRTYWKLSNLVFDDVKDAISVGVNILNKRGDVISDKELGEEIVKVIASKSKKLEANFCLAALEIDKRIKRVPEGFGLVSWRHINPRSIRDKAYIVLKKSQEPLHFVEIANRISSSGFDKKLVTTQAVHNELIRYEQFVLVGRGLYALREWGYKKGTVSEVIESLLKKKAPLSKQEIMTGVLKQRKVKKGTISLNLQKNPQFIRVGRAVYDLAENLG